MFRVSATRGPLCLRCPLSFPERPAPPSVCISPPLWTRPLPRVICPRDDREEATSDVQTSQSAHLLQRRGSPRAIRRGAAPAPDAYRRAGPTGPGPCGQRHLDRRASADA